MIEPFDFGADVQDKSGETPGDDILAAHMNNLRAWLAYTAALGRNANTETLAENKTLVDSDEPIQFLDPSATEYTVELPAEGLANHVFYFVNTSDTYDLEILDDAAATIVTVEPEKAAVVMSDGTDWKLIATTNAAAASPATQITETSGPTTLDIGAIADGEHLLRDGTDLVGKTPYEYQNGGWTEVPDGLWSYASATTITVPSGAASIYAVGDQVRLKQGGAYKYFYVIGVADTVLTVTGGSDFTVANATITDVAFSKCGGVGHPKKFSFTTNPQGFSAIVQNIAEFAMNGRSVNVYVDIGGTSNATTLSFNVPVGTFGGYILTGWVYSPAISVNSPLIEGSSTTFNVYKDGALTAWASSGDKRVLLNFSYLM